MDFQEQIDRRLAKVSLAEIDLHDPYYQISYGAVPSTLIDSLRTAGVINPPTLQRKQDGRWRIVAGFRRCAFCQEQGAKKITAWCVENVAPELSLFIWAVCDNLGVRQLNTVECAIVLAKLHGQFRIPKGDLARRYMPLLGLGSSTELVERYLRLAALEEPMREWLAEEWLSQEAAFQLVEMAPDEARALFAVIAALRLGKNYQRELIRLAYDVARREALSIRELVASPELRAAMQEQELSPAHKAERVLGWLRERRFPRLALARRRYAELVRQLSLPANIRLSPPPYFEGAEWYCQLQFASQEELRQMAERLQKIAQCAELQQLLLLP